MEIRVLTDNMIEPIHGSSVVALKKKSGASESKRIHFWTKPLDQVILDQLTKWRRLNIDLITQVRGVELVDGGDHGQGRFAQVAKIIIRGENRKVLADFHIKIADIKCEKDTYDLYQATVGPPLSKDIDALS
jgi:hypothetical protein